MLRRIQLFPLLWLMVVWIIAWGSYSPMIIVGGLALGAFLGCTWWLGPLVVLLVWAVGCSLACARWFRWE